MKAWDEYKRELWEGAYDSRFLEVYLDQNLVPYNKKRYEEAIESFRRLFGEKDTDRSLLMNMRRP